MHFESQHINSTVTPWIHDSHTHEKFFHKLLGLIDDKLVGNIYY